MPTDQDQPTTLDQVAHLLADAAAHGDRDLPVGGSAALVRARTDSQGVDVAVLSGVGDPAVAMRGTDLPEPWDAVGIVSPATAHRLDPPTAAEGTTCRIGFALMVARDGTMTHAVRSAEADDPPWLPAAARNGGAGRLVDACRRTIGLPTAPPEGSPAALWSALWLDAVTTWVLAEPSGPHPWADVAAMHPASRLLGVPVVSLVAECALDDAAARLAVECTWADARRAIAEGLVTVPGLEPTHARWFDDGSLSRAAPEGLPEIPDALSMLDAVVTPTVLARIAAVVLHSARAADAAVASSTGGT